eukprot:CAMPEP_0116146948 /NCGR_PEP_ID=MMETSP0329-20121206/17457_1 /TAXON_ID=697910 /ORGANISM="Pseudo-nitzschia arenysensis, Strain B593" /LENGTH=469 /DNA_ID=CAMNT_0003642771 /DNA_START=80 /DNA_END=1489 /DNA_ORIENTATION=+
MSSTTTTMSSPPTVEQAIRWILQKNFDADSKVCFLTLLKIIDNILQKPGNEKVRSLRTGNATIRSKILDKHGHHLLMACGFVHEPADVKWQNEERLVLYETKEDTAVLVKARHTLARIATLELGLQAGEIPPFKAPQAPVSIAKKTPSSSSSSSGGFNVYSTSRYDGKSAAIGANLGAPKNWKSKTEQELESLKQREAKLQNQMAKKQPSNQSSAAANRQWTVFLPGQAQTQTPQVTAAAASSSSSSTNTTTSTKGDASLLATHFKEQHAKRVAADNRGFTTKAMRDLEKLKKTKVYSHTQLAIHFPDGISVRANFSTRDKLEVVLQGLKRQVLLLSTSDTTTLPLPDFELYQTPPRRVLGASETLQALGLVPAAKVYVSWKKALPKLPQAAGSAWYIRPELIGGTTAASASSSSSSSSSPALPTSVPVLATAASTTTTKDTAATATAKRKKTRAEKEAALMKRMLGKR